MYVNDPLSGLVAVVYMMFRDYIISAGPFSTSSRAGVRFHVTGAS